MGVDLALETKLFIFPLVAVIYIFGLSFVEGYYRKLERGPETDQEFLWRVARQRESSEYQLFVNAGKDWHTTKAGIEEDFKDYVLHDRVPFYVRDFIRRERQAEQDRRAQDATSKAVN